MPSPQAIGQARRSLSREVCDTAFAAVYEHCSALSQRPVVRYGGYRLLAVDGTRLSLPPAPALAEAFGLPSNQHGEAAAPMAGLVQIWDVGRNCPVAFSLTRCDYSERGEAIGLFDRLGPQDLLIGDRGYPSHAFFLALCRRRARFLVCMPLTGHALVESFVASGAEDAVVLWRVRDHRGQQRPGTPTIPIRLVRVSLPDGRLEVLATNLWRQRGHDRDTIAHLYTQRWRIETAFREMKVFHALERFSATYPDGIYQEIVAIQIFLLLTSELEAIARRETEHLQHQVSHGSPAATDVTPLREAGIRFNRLIIADNVIHLLRHAAIGGQSAVADALPGIIAYLWKNRSYPRPGRSYPRQRKRSLGHFRTSGG